MSKSKLKEYRRVYEEGSYIYEEGERGDTVFLIDSGSVDIFKGTSPNQRKITTLDDGEIVGEMALAHGEHERTATVQAASDVTGWRFPGPAFESLIDQNDSFRENLFRSLIDRLINTTKRLRDQESTDLQRLNRLLLKAAGPLLGLFSSAELESSDGSKCISPDHSDEYLAYRFDGSPDVLQSFYRYLGGAEEDPTDDPVGEDLAGFVESIVEKTTDRIEVSLDGDGEPDEELIKALRTGRSVLSKLEDHSKTYEKETLQTFMETRKTLMEVVEERREQGRDDYVINRLQELLTGIKQEINLRHN